MRNSNVTSKELALLFVMQDMGGSITSLSILPEDYKHLSLHVLRSCEKKGFVSPVSQQQAMWQISQSGKALLQKYSRPAPDLTAEMAIRLLREIKQVAGDEAAVHSACDRALKKYFHLQD